jgi:hypothetical protein
MTSVQPTYIKILLFFKKRPDITEQFHDHWTTVSIPFPYIRELSMPFPVSQEY